MSKVVPEGWSIRKLDGKIKILSGFPFKSEFFTNDPEYMGIIRIRNLDKQNLETFYTDDFEEQYIVTKGDVLIGLDGDFNIVKWKSADALLNQRVCKIKAKDNSGFDTDFLFQSLKEDLLKIHATTGATTVKHLSVKDIRGIEKAYPPLPEQQKIATILSSVDNVIEKTRTQIDKLKDLKTGMMQELLTKGIGHTEFKDSPIGRIPVSWEVKALGELIGSVEGGVSVNGENREKNYNEIGVLKVSSVFKGGFLPEEHKAVVPEDINRVRVNPKKDHILFSRANTPQLVGESAYIEKDYYDLFLPDKLWMINIKNREMISARWLSYTLCSSRVRAAISDMATGSSGSMKNISKSGLLSLKVPTPSFLEQVEVSQSLRSIDISIIRFKKRLDEFSGLKSALAKDLLTGRVRVGAV